MDAGDGWIAGLDIDVKETDEIEVIKG